MTPDKLKELAERMTKVAKVLQWSKTCDEAAALLIALAEAQRVTLVRCAPNTAWGQTFDKPWPNREYATALIIPEKL